jgi:splicing factor U2AF subunit
MSDRGRERRDRSPDRRHRRSLTPIHLRKRKLNNWDQPPPGYDGMTVQQVKAMGHFPGNFNTC